MRDGVIGGNEVMENDIFPYRERIPFTSILLTGEFNSRPGSHM